VNGAMRLSHGLPGPICIDVCTLISGTDRHDPSRSSGVNIAVAITHDDERDRNIQSHQH